MGDVNHRYQASYRVLFAALWLTLLVLAVKLWASWATKSLSILADFLHTLLDCFSIGLSLTTTAKLEQIANPEIHLQDLRTHRKRHTAVVLIPHGIARIRGVYAADNLFLPSPAVLGRSSHAAAAQGGFTASHAVGDRHRDSALPGFI